MGIMVMQKRPGVSRLVSGRRSRREPELSESCRTFSPSSRRLVRMTSVRLIERCSIAILVNSDLVCAFLRIALRLFRGNATGRSRLHNRNEFRSVALDRLEMLSRCVVVGFTGLRHQVADENLRGLGFADRRAPLARPAGSAGCWCKANLDPPLSRRRLESLQAPPAGEGTAPAPDASAESGTRDAEICVSPRTTVPSSSSATRRTSLIVAG